MAVSAFRSTSKRGNFSSSSTTISSAKEKGAADDVGRNASHRRSRSVSALSRTSSGISSASSSNIFEFANKRDNPLFCNSSQSSPDEFESKSLSPITKFAKNGGRVGESVKKSTNSGVFDGRRGRSVTRVSDYKSDGRIEFGRGSLRVDTGRCRSLSRGHYGTSENKASELSKNARSPQTWSSRHHALEPSEGSSSSVIDLHWEDANSISSFSEAEEKTIKAVFEQMKNDQSGDATAVGIYETVRSEVKRVVSEIRSDIENAFQIKHPAIMATADVADIPPEMVNPDAIELVSNIRREYAAKFEQSQDRCRKLREELALEERRGQELGRILREILPDPKTSESQNSRPRRRTSIERRKMSRRLAEDAMNYFDECVSISTFDSSDFSAPEDLPSGLVVTNNCIDDHLDYKNPNQVQHSFIREERARNSSSNTSMMNEFKQSLFGPGTRPENVHLASTEGFRDIQTFVRKFEKELKKDSIEVAKSSYDFDEYKSSFAAEKILFDRVIFKNRIKSGGLLLCHARTF